LHGKNTLECCIDEELNGMTTCKKLLEFIFEQERNEKNYEMLMAVLPIVTRGKIKFPEIAAFFNDDQDEEQPNMLTFARKVKDIKLPRFSHISTYMCDVDVND